MHTLRKLSDSSDYMLRITFVRHLWHRRTVTSKMSLLNYSMRTYLLFLQFVISDRPIVFIGEILSLLLEFRILKN